VLHAGGKLVVIRVNDANREVAPASTVGSLLRELGLAERQGIAVALNDCVVPRSGWTSRELREADCVVVLQAMQGG
jgi:sulfur carrier protein